MTIHIYAKLRCDGCAAAYPLAVEAEDILFARDLVKLRDRAADEAAWKRLRPNRQRNFGDYCGNCAARIMAARRPRRPRYPTRGVEKP